MAEGSSQLGKPVIITCAVVGAELTRSQAPYLPLTPDEIASSAIQAHEAGAAMVHLHVRDEQGRPTCRTEVFSQVIQKIRAACDVVIQVSTGGAIGDTEADRLLPLEAGPDMASLTTGSVNFGSEVFLNPQSFVEKLAQTMKDKGIKPEIEVFDTAMLENAFQLVKKGILAEPLHLDWVLGVPGALKATEKNLDFLISDLPAIHTWSVAAIGRHQFPMVALALRKGGHVRVGMEDNLYLEKGVLAQSNAQLVEKAALMAQELGRPVASAAEARKLLHLTLPR